MHAWGCSQVADFHMALPDQAALLVLARLARLGGAGNARLSRVLFPLLAAGEYGRCARGVRACAAWACAHFGAASATAGSRFRAS